MKIVRLGMTEGGILLLTFVQRYCNPDYNTNNVINQYIMNLVNWLYTTSGYYDKQVLGNKFNFNYTALNANYHKFLSHLEDSINGCEETQFYFHNGFIMNLFLQYKQQFINKYNIKNLVLLNETKFIDRIPSIFDYLQNKKVLVISAFDGLIQGQYESGNVYKIYDNFPIIKGLEVIKFPYCFLNNGPHNNYFETLDAVFEEVKKIDFDIALLGCGSYGHMLCHKIDKVLHKEAIYIGGCITNLFGILSTRERIHSNLKINKYWITQIPDDYKPKNYKEIEDGCYW